MEHRMSRMSHTWSLSAIIAEHHPFVRIARDKDFTFTEDSQFVTLDVGLDVSGQVREHHITRSYFLYHAKNIMRIPLTTLHVATPAEPFRQ